ncbi:hypothetical protein HYALB_00008932 [Hymenoscyphus albidus]|uniref:Uncharacterized protein n=1 Tax=Hymenoscyphus albidus TaxID=595503 RepID=A0A9N9LJX0_9HELO|nr:hypothetical protein HYALB_00008932 [Hymenoscyphus albidus]
MAQSEAPSKSEAEYTRLHITPFEPNLLKAILPPSILPNARNISYHTIATFPEKAYGFVDLPIMDAEKIKKKLNGAILKGTKVRVEKARPEKEGVAVVEEEGKMSKKEKKLSKKRKRDDTIPAVEILDRSVKRGWTTPLATAYSKDKEKRVNKSKFTTGPECLFKTVIPANVATGSKTSATDKVERKRHKAGKEAIVHEFAKMTKYATFLRSTAAGNKKISAEFVEGKGWVDEDGNVIEEVTIKMVKTSESNKPESKSEPVAEEENESESDSSDGDSSDSASSSDEDEDEENQKEEQEKMSIDKTDLPVSKPAPTSAPPAEEDSETSSSGSSSEDSESDSDSEDSSKAESAEEKESSSESENETVDSKPASRPQSSSGAPLNLSIKIPVPEITTTPVPPTEVHPLEALFKRPKPDNKDLAPKPAPSSFSFFGADDDIDEEMEEESQDKVPLTPFTQRDFEYRGMRSAAPTPDTAHANKKFLWPSVHDEYVDDEHTPTSPTRPQKKGESSKAKPKESKVREEGAAPETDFQKWFYENRGDTNRAWKKRRKVVGKEKRHRENKKRSDRV